MPGTDPTELWRYQLFASYDVDLTIRNFWVPAISASYESGPDDTGCGDSRYVLPMKWTLSSMAFIEFFDTEFTGTSPLLPYALPLLPFACATGCPILTRAGLVRYCPTHALRDVRY